MNVKSPKKKSATKTPPAAPKKTPPPPPKTVAKASAKTAAKPAAKPAPAVAPPPRKGTKEAAKGKPVAAVATSPKAKLAEKPAKPAKPTKPPKPPKPPVRTLGKKDLEHFRTVLLETQHEWTEAYRVSKGDSRSNLDNGTEDYIDYAVNSYAKEFLLSLNEMDRKQLLLVREALRRIDRGEFGLCLRCGQEIARKRLDVAPWARHCVRCQELEEQGLLARSGYPADGEDLENAALALEDDDYVPRLDHDEKEEEEEAEAEEEEDDEEEPVVAPEETIVIEGDEEE